MQIHSDNNSKILYRPRTSKVKQCICKMSKQYKRYIVPQTNVDKFEKSSNESCNKSISFKGYYTITRADKKDINELLNIFYASFTQNIEPNRKPHKFLDKIDRFLVTYPFKFLAWKSDTVTETVKINNKIAGGYSMTQLDDKTAYLNFMTLAHEYKKTKKGAMVILDIGKRICQNAELNGIEILKFSTNSDNSQINRLLRRLPLKQEGDISDETKYSLRINDLKNSLGISY